MLIGQQYIKDGSLILRDVDGSEESIPLADALELLDWLIEHKSEIETQLQEQERLPDWKTIEAQAKIDLENIQTDQDAYAFIAKYFVEDLQPDYRKIYRSDRHEMNRTPRQAIDNILSLPPLQ